MRLATLYSLQLPAELDFLKALALNPGGTKNIGLHHCLQDKVLVDTAFWAGLVPQNAHQPKQLQQLIAGGALGFKAFMSPSGIDDFDNVSVEDVAAAPPTIKKLGVPLLIHAELVDADIPTGVGGEARALLPWL